MKGRQSEEFEKVLGYRYVEEIVQREDLVVLDLKNNGQMFDRGAGAGAGPGSANTAGLGQRRVQE